MRIGLLAGLTWIAKVSALTLVWYGLYRANGYVFDRLEISPHASWIFLPAALRVIYPLVFQEAGLVALFLGGYFVLPYSAGTLPDRLTLAFLSAATPLIGIFVCQAVHKFSWDLRDLGPRHLFDLALACAAANSLVLNSYLVMTGDALKPVMQLVTLFVGDVLGTAIVLYAVAMAANLFMPKAKP